MAILLKLGIAIKVDRIGIYSMTRVTFLEIGRSQTKNSGESLLLNRKRRLRQIHQRYVLCMNVYNYKHNKAYTVHLTLPGLHVI